MLMTPFTPTWTLFLLAMLGFGLALWAVLRRAPDRTRRLALVAVAVANWAMSTYFTFDRILDPAIPDFVFSQNWPSHFCTLVTILLVPAMWFRPDPASRWRFWVRPLHTLLFFPGALAGFLVLFSPAAEYTELPVFHENTLFYLVHALNVVLPFVHAALGYYRPRYRDALLSLVWFAIVALGVLAITLFARAFVDPAANYMYFFDPMGAGILVVLWDLIGIPVLYELPLVPILAPVLLLMCAIHHGIEALARRASRRPLEAVPA
ncbi:YwaF family protein [Microbacterium sediminis]|uniref:TMEM164 family acyltransferase n=1 Tax=Microbacterium sediminis TaxID=904291 RepID=UPI0010722E63|nr:YwaF family protein [Microbacterium sediminis]QBR74939.1 hypothetical protein E3O41_11415 [Microbacterium sediminis]